MADQSPHSHDQLVRVDVSAIHPMVRFRPLPRPLRPVLPRHLHDRLGVHCPLVRRLQRFCRRGAVFHARNLVWVRHASLGAYVRGSWISMGEPQPPSPHRNLPADPDEHPYRHRACSPSSPCRWLFCRPCSTSSARKLELARHSPARLPERKQQRGKRSKGSSLRKSKKHRAYMDTDYYTLHKTCKSTALERCALHLKVNVNLSQSASFPHCIYKHLDRQTSQYRMCSRSHCDSELICFESGSWFVCLEKMIHRCESYMRLCCLDLF
jgi:hypothetical protein